MRVLVSTSTFPAQADDGIPRFVYDLAEALAAHVDVSVLAPDAPNAQKHERMGSVDVRRFSYFAPRRWQRLALSPGMRDNLRGSWLARFQVPFFLLSQAWMTHTLVCRHRIDAVNAHWIVPQGLTAAIVRGRRGRFKLLLHVHAGDVYLLRKLSGGRAIGRYIVERTDAIFADGSHVRDSLDELLGYRSGAVIQPMGVHRAVFGRDQAECERPALVTPESFSDGFLLCVGRMVEKKGMVHLIRALPRVRRQCPGLGLVLIGSGPEENVLHHEVEQLGLRDAVYFAGRQPHPEIVRYLHDCRLAVVPSIIDSRGETEGMPTVVVEALAAGVKVVGSAVDGIPDVLRHEENGWLCRPGDPEDMARKIVAALDYPDSSSIVRSALETAAQYDWEQVALNYMRYLQPLGPQSAEEAT